MVAKIDSILDRLLKEKIITNCLEYMSEHLSETYEHSLRVCRLCLHLGIENDLDPPDLWLLGYASLLHDVGKIKIPKDILAKPARLDTQEYKVVQSHPRLGFIELDNIESGKVKEIVVAHHEFTSTPYPRNGEERRNSTRGSIDRRFIKPKVLTMAQMIAIADMVDALVHARSYKEAYTIEQTREILESKFTGEKKFIDQVLPMVYTDC